MKQKYLLWVVGLAILWSISWLWVRAADNIDVGSFNFTVPTFKAIFLKLQWSELQTEGVRLDAGGLYVAQEALLPGTAGNTMKIWSDGKVIRSLIQGSNIADNAIGSNHIANGGIQNVDIGNLQISNSHIQNQSLGANVFASDVNFVGSWLFYYTNWACTGANGITSIVNGNVVCAPLSSLWGGNGAGCLEWQTPVMGENGSWQCVAVLLGSTGDGDMHWDNNTWYTCTRWFNGCNTCAYQSPNDLTNSMVMCTQAYCAPSEYTEWYCIEWFQWYTEWLSYNSPFSSTGTITDIWNANFSGNVWVGLTQPTETLQAEQDVRVDANNGNNNVGEIYCHKTDSWVPSSEYNIANCATCENPWFVYNATSNMCEKVACEWSTNSCGLTRTIDPTFGLSQEKLVFWPSMLEGHIWQIKLQADGNIVIGGWFNTVNGSTYPPMIRLTANGNIDNSFTLWDPLLKQIGAIGINPTNGKFIVSWPTSLYSATPPKSARLNTDGSTYAGWFTGALNHITFLSDGRFIAVNGKKIMRFNTNGSIDTTFNQWWIGFTEEAILNPPTTIIQAIAPQTDGKILVGWLLYKYNGVNVKSLIRLNSDGSLDTTFNQGNTGLSWTNRMPSVLSIVLQADGKMLIWGQFWSTYNGVNIGNIMRLNANGTLDTTFNQWGIGFDSLGVEVIKIDSDWKIYVWGQFTTYNNINANSLVRLSPNGSLDMCTKNWQWTSDKYNFEGISDMVLTNWWIIIWWQRGIDDDPSTPTDEFGSRWFVTKVIK